MSFLTFKAQTTDGEQTRRISAFNSKLQSDVDRVLMKLRAASQAGPGQDVVTPLVAAAERMGRHLLSDDDARWLNSLPSGTLLTIEGPLSCMSIPFELIRLRDSWLSCEFSVGRIVTDFRYRRSSDPACQANQTLCVAAPHRELLWVTAEEATVSKSLHELAARTSFLPPSDMVLQKSADEVLAVLESCGWWHFAGHGIEVDGQRVLQLEDGTTISAANIRKLERLPEFVFLNACGSLNVPTSAADRSLTAACLQMGAHWLLGTTVPFTDDGSWEFVKAFYSSVNRGKTLGESVRTAHRHCARLMPNSVAHLTYAFYGDPGHQFIDDGAGVKPPLKERVTAAAKPFAPSVDDRTAAPDSELPIWRGTSDWDASPVNHTESSDDDREAAWASLLSAFDEATERFATIRNPLSGSESPVSFRRSTPRNKLQDQWEAMRCPAPDVSPEAEFVATIGQPGTRDTRQVKISLTWRDVLESADTVKRNEATDISVIVVRRPVSAVDLHRFRRDAGTDAGSVVLYDLSTGQAHFRPNDIAVIPWRDLFDLETDHAQTLRVLNWVRDRLPTPVSIGGQDVARKLGARLQNVEHAFRLAAESENVTLQETSRYGLVLDHPGKS